MKRARQQKIPLETQLGLLAMRFRSTRDEAERASVAGRYDQIVKQLIRSREWEEMPAFEDMLPDEWMPEAFFKFWSIPSPPCQQHTDNTTPTVTIIYPLFILMDGKVPAIVCGKEGKARVPALAVFTERELAEQYRDQNLPKGKVSPLPDEESFARVLKIIRELIAVVVFDLGSGGKRMKMIPVDEMLRMLPDAP
jgi:hypothetical protein